MPYDARKIEEKWQKKWQAARAFEPKTRKAKTGKGRKFFFTVPYPYTSGPLHIGHGRTFALGDVQARFKRLQGFNVLWPMGFHMSGTPVLAVSDSIKRRDAKTLELYESYVRIYEKDPLKAKVLVQSFEGPWNVARYFAEHIQEDFKRMGFSIDWTRQFATAEPLYNAFIEWQYMHLREKGFITKGKHAVLYSPLDKNAVGEDDIEDGDTNPVEITEFVGVKFAFEDGHLMASTLRPETVYGCTNAWVNPNAVYVKARVNESVLFVSMEAFEKLSVQGHTVEKLGEFKGSYFSFKECVVPLAGRKVPIVPTAFVDADRASGFVYSVPAHAPFDWVALEDAKKEFPENEAVQKIQPIQVVRMGGYSAFPARDACQAFGVKSQQDSMALEKATAHLYQDEFYKGRLLDNCGPFAGMPVKEAKEAAKKELEARRDAFVFLETSRPAVTRARKKVVVGVFLDQWFLDYGNAEWKEKARACLAYMSVIPENYRRDLAGAIEWLHERACARKRGLGTALPWDKDWMIESLSDSTIYMALYTIAPIIRRMKVSLLTPAFFDAVFYGKKAPKGLEKQVRACRSQFEYWYPNDERHTAPAHISNHLAFSIFHHVALFDKKYWPGAFTFNEFLIREGQKMSKSKGNVIPLYDVVEKYGIDVYRLFVVGSAEMDSVVDWRDEEVGQATKKLAEFYGLIEMAAKTRALKKREIGFLEEWLENQFHRHAQTALNGVGDYHFKIAVNALFFEFLNDLRLYKRLSGKSAAPLAKRFAREWVQILSPIIPHACEELWALHKGKGLVSLSTLKFKPKPNKELEERASYLFGVLEDVRRIQEIARIQAPKKVTLFTSPKWKWRAWNEMVKVCGRQPDLGTAMRAVMGLKEVKGREAEASTLVKYSVKRLVPTVYLTELNELKTLNDARTFFEGNLQCPIEIVQAEKSTHAKASNALPLKPAILVE